MIFVTVGTHEQQFNRLIKCMDNWASEHDEEVIIQTGFSTYEPIHCKWKKFFAYQDMSENIIEARIVITHGGPSSFIAPLQIGKVPIVFPRKKEFDEHVNDHQVDFCRQVSERMGNIILVENTEELINTINYYNSIVQNMSAKSLSNNKHFCDDLKRIVNEMFQS